MSTSTSVPDKRILLLYRAGMNKPSSPSLPLVGDVSGFPEYLPQQQRGFEHAVATIRRVYERFGFVPLETACVERTETLLAKGIAAKEVYGLRRLNVEDGEDGSKDVALRFDLTVPMARYVVQNQGALVFPFRRYQIQPVWRGERPKAGRYRQFYQCDIDTIGDGSLPMTADAEVIACAHEALVALGVGKFTMRVNNRKLLAGLLAWAGFADAQAAIKVIDDVEKVGWDKTAKLLHDLAPDAKVDAFVKVLQAPAPLASIPAEAGVGEAVDELKRVIDLAREMAGVSTMDASIKADLTIARGLDYYTGTVVETTLGAAPELGSICSGGRYENLAASLGKKPFPGVGLSIGLSRLVSWLLTQEPYVSLPLSPAKVVVTCQDAALADHYAKVAAMIRKAGIATEMALGGALGTQFKNADKKGIRYAVIIGQTEFAAQQAVVKDLQSGVQETVALADVAKRLG